MPTRISNLVARLARRAREIAVGVIGCWATITGWCRRHEYMIRAAGAAVAIAGVLLTGVQTRLLVQEHRATFRPSLCVESIATQWNNSSLDILISVKNYGQVPSQVDLRKVIIGGASIEYDERTGIFTVTYTSNSSYVVPLVAQDYSSDWIFFPGKAQPIIVADVHRATYQDTVLETKVMHVALLYSSGRNQYYYIAKATLENGTWKVVEHRGN